MISDPTVRAEIARDFAVVRKLRNEWNVVRMIPGGPAVQMSPSEEFPSRSSARRNPQSYPLRIREELSNCVGPLLCFTEAP